VCVLARFYHLYCFFYCFLCSLFCYLSLLVHWSGIYKEIKGVHRSIHHSNTINWVALTYKHGLHLLLFILLRCGSHLKNPKLKSLTIDPIQLSSHFPLFIEPFSILSTLFILIQMHPRRLFILCHRNFPSKLRIWSPDCKPWSKAYLHHPIDNLNHLSSIVWAHRSYKHS
jgi:hypothetical protein